MLDWCHSFLDLFFGNLYTVSRWGQRRVQIWDFGKVFEIDIQQ